MLGLGIYIQWNLYNTDTLGPAIGVVKYVTLHHFCNFDSFD